MSERVFELVPESASDAIAAASRPRAQLHCDVLVIGAGPAGIAAALRASDAGADVLLIDQQNEPGGQVWRGEWRKLLCAPATVDALARPVLNELRARLCAIGAAHIAPPATGGAPCIRFRGDCRVVQKISDQQIVCDGEQAATIRFRRVVIAAGAREVFLPFPGWTLPGVTGAGGLQVMVKDGLDVRGQRVVIAGSGPLLLAAAASLHKAGADVLLIAEQAPRAQVMKFAATLWRYPALLKQAAHLRWQTRGSAYQFATWITRAEGDGRVQRVHWQDARGRRGEIACDWLACAYGLTPAGELAALFDVHEVILNEVMPGEAMPGKVIQREGTQNDPAQNDAAGIGNVHFAGEQLGIGGARRALASGAWAGARAAAALAAGDKSAAAAPRTPNDQKLRSEMRLWTPYGSALQNGFALRSELLQLADDQTLLCRCENVSVGEVRACGDFRSAKLATRMGMGACQGRVCGRAAALLFNWPVGHTRAPFFPTRIETLMSSALAPNNSFSAGETVAQIVPAPDTQANTSANASVNLSVNAQRNSQQDMQQHASHTATQNRFHAATPAAEQAVNER